MKIENKDGGGTKLQKGGLSLHDRIMKRKVRATQGAVLVNGKPAVTSVKM